MAIVKYSNIVEELRGNLNGTVFSKYLGGFNGYKKGQPSPWGTARQQEIRQNFKNLTGLWNSYTQGQRDAWEFVAANTPVPNRFGEPTIISGYAYFQKFQLNERSLGNFTYPVPNQTLNPTYEGEVYNYNFAVSQAGAFYLITQLQVNIRILETSLDDNYFTVQVSRPFSRPDQNYTGTYYTVGYHFRSSGSTPGQTFPFTGTNVTMPVGWYSFPNAWHRVKVIPRTQNSAQEGEPFYYTIQASFAPPVFEYEPELDLSIPLMDVVPSQQNLENLNVYLQGLKAAAGLPLGVLNLATAYDAVYLFAQNTFHNARIDFSTQTLRGTEIANPGFSIDFQAYRGISRGVGGTIAFDTGFDITAGSQAANVNNHHIALAINSDAVDSSTNRIAGQAYENMEFIPLQAIGGTPSFRLRDASFSLASFPNNDIRGAYVIERPNASDIVYTKNAQAPATASYPATTMDAGNFFVLASNDAGSPEAPRTGVQVSHFTAGADGVDSSLINATLRNYLAQYGFIIY